MSIGKRIKGARLAAGFRYAADLARAAQVSKQYLFNLEHDKVKKPDPHQLLLIASVLHVSIEWLVTGKGLPGTDQIKPGMQADIIRAYAQLTRNQQQIVLNLAKQLRSKK